MSRSQYDPRLINILSEVAQEELEKAEIRIVKRVAEELGISPESPPIDVDLSKIDWKTKHGDSASLNTKWAWAHAYDIDGKLKAETKKLVHILQRYGKIEAEGFEISLSGRGGRLLNRKKVKS